MIRKFIFGFIWFVVIAFSTTVVLGIAAGLTIDAQHAEKVGETFALLAPYILGLAFLVAVIGTISGFLPGTKTRVKGL